MAQLTRVGVGGVGKTYGAITDKAEGEAPATPRPGTLFTRIGVGGVGITFGTITAKAETIIVEPPIPQPEIPGTGGGGREPGYTRHRETDLEQTRRRRILQEDEEVIALIMAMVTEGLM